MKDGTVQICVATNRWTQGWEVVYGTQDTLMIPLLSTFPINGEGAKKKGALKGIWVAMKDFPSTPIKMASLIGNMVNWRYCRIKWELTNQLGLNLESKW